MRMKADAGLRRATASRCHKRIVGEAEVDNGMGGMGGAFNLATLLRRVLVCFVGGYGCWILGARIGCARSAAESGMRSPDAGRGTG